MTNPIDEVTRLIGVPIRKRHAGHLTMRVAGTGPALVLLHGGGGSWTHWARNIRALARDFTLYLPDQPGMGDSPRVPPQIDIEPYTDLIIDAIDAVLPPPVRYGIAGFSFGGLNAAVIAARRAKRVRALTMVGPGGFRKNEAFRLDLPAKRPDMTDAEIDTLHRSNMGTLLIHDHRLITDRLVRLQRYNIEHAHYNGRKIGYGDHLTRYLPRVRCPAQLMLGANDPLPRPSVRARAAHIQELAPQCEVHILEKASHWANFEQADKVNPLLADFHRQAVATEDPATATLEENA
ncbi:MAG: alpha/beta fold hydrolase [Alphaproteobacteria bacterium]